jgi:hypothetical protein
VQHGAVGEGQDTAGHQPRARASVQETAEHLGTTVDAIRKRVQRDTIAHEKDESGRVWILLDADRTRHATIRDTTGHRQDHESSPLISEMRARIEDLRDQLEAERQGHAEARRLLMAALERIPPQLEAPQEAQESPATVQEEQDRAEPRPDAGGAQEGAQRPWWRRLIGG